jgi:hypothetical protein
MYFLVDTKDQSVTAFKNNGLACRALLKKINIDILPGDDPVKLARENAGDRLIVLNLSGAFEAISTSNDQAAQELAESFKQAVDNFFQ